MQGIQNPGRNDQGRFGQGRIVMLSVRHRCHGRKDVQQGIGCEVTVYVKTDILWSRTNSKKESKTLNCLVLTQRKIQFLLYSQLID
jgi:hypothetical protein